MQWWQYSPATKRDSNPFEIKERGFGIGKDETKDNKSISLNTGLGACFIWKYFENIGFQDAISFILKSKSEEILSWMIW